MHKYVGLLAVILLSPTIAFAWGEDGHVVVCRIAESYLKPAARAAIKDLLDDRSIADPRLCVWADLIRSGAIYDKKYPNHRTWHYINLELKLKEADFKPDDDKDQDNVVGAIGRFAKLLKTGESEKEDRKEALLFLIHFVGDMHQPLHCSNRDDDKGGNMQPVKSFNGNEEAKLNLHAVWDTHLFKAERGDLANDDFAKRLVAEIAEKDRESWVKSDVKVWAWESHLIGVKEVYCFTDGTVLPKPSDPAVELTNENYIKSKKPFVREQLKKAGVRLAHVLNGCFPEK